MRLQTVIFFVKRTGLFNYFEEKLDWPTYKVALKYGIMPGCLPAGQCTWGLRLDMTFYKSTVTKLRTTYTAFVNVTLLIYQQMYLAINCQIVT